VVQAQTVNPIVEKKKHEVLSWFFNFYWEESTGKIWLQIDKLDEEILYQTSLPAGLGSNDVGLDRGILGTIRSQI
jgi:hypothetical protein